MTENNEAGFEPGVEVRPVTPGWEYIVKNGDGTATKGWEPTRRLALEKVSNVTN